MSCSYIDIDLISDLKSHSISQIDSGECQILYEGDTDPYSIIIDWTNFVKILPSTSSALNTWLPIIARPNNSHILTKKVGRNFTSNPTKLGIEKFISFVPKFKSWDVVEDDALFCLDWLSNDDNFLYDPIYSIMGWIKYLDKDTITTQTAPINSVFLLNNQKKYVKYNDSLFIDLIPGNASKFVNVADLPKDIVIDYSSISSKLNNLPANIYISDGDFLAYDLNSSITAINYSKDPEAAGSLTYISPTLWKDYQHIYDIITKSYGSFRIGAISQKQKRLFKKLAGILATHPLKDRITAEIFLDLDISIYIKNFINGSYANIDLELNAINVLITNLYKVKCFKDILARPEYSNSLGGFINTPSDLVNRLISKYKPYLLIDKDHQPDITYSKQLSDGPHVWVNQIFTTHCNASTTKTTLKNNMSIKVGDILFKTDFIDKKSEYNIFVDNKLSDNIPLFDCAKYFTLYGIDQNIGVSAGPDIYIPIITAQNNACGKPSELNGFSFAPNINRLTTGNNLFGDHTSYTIDVKNIEKIINDYNTKQANDLTKLYPFLNIESASYSWKLIGGNTNGITIVDDSTLTPTFKFTTFGKYILQLTVNIDDLQIIDRINIYVVNETGCNIGIDSNGLPAFKTKFVDDNGKTNIVDGAVGYIPNKYYSEDSSANITFSQDRSGKILPYLDNRYAIPLIAKNDRNKCIVPGIIDIAISKYGAIYIPQSNSYVDFVSRAILPIEDGQYAGRDTVVRLNNYPRLSKFFFTPSTAEYTEPSNLTISYTPNNTTIKLYKIALNKLRSPVNPNCYPIYQNLLYQWNQVTLNRQSIETAYGRDIPSQTSTFNRYVDGIWQNTKELNPMPELSTYNMPKLLPFGANDAGPFGTDIDKDRFFPNDKTISIGHVIDKEPVICLLREAEIQSETNKQHNYPINNPNIKFTKGTFHPSFGFIAGNNEWKNLTSSLKFNTGNRSTFVFKGPGFLNSLSTQNQQRSTISLTNKSYDVGSDDRGEKLEDISEKDDLDIHHGYRKLSGNFTTTVNRDHLLYDEYDGEYGSYDFSVRGRRLSINNRLYGSDLILSRLKNIEVKLNFLNQINLKNVKIWIDFAPCGSVIQATYPDSTAIADAGKYKNDPYASLISLNPNSLIISNIPLEHQGMKDGKVSRNANKFLKHVEIIEYLNILANNNEPYSLLLLNQEHVDANDIDTVLHFSDRFSKYLTARNTNVSKSLYVNQKSNVTNYIKLQPTLHLPPRIIDIDLQNNIFTYDDKLSDLYVNALKTNNIFWPVNSFSKYFNQPLFMGEVPDNAPPGIISKPDSGISVTLNIQVLDDHDMQNIDTIANLGKKIGHDLTTNKQTADTVFNSLCSWEVILDIDSREFKQTDSLGKIKYGFHPNIPGYNFISSDINIQHKLPQSVINAPNQHINDLSSCYYDKTTDESLSPLRRSGDYRFPNEALALGLAALALGAIGGLIGISVGFGVLMAALAGITQFLTGLRRQQVADALGRVFEKSVYTECPQAGPDKILLHVNSNGPIVYDVEASIYKYTNTPLLKQKIRNYIKPGKDFLPELGTFKCQSVFNQTDLFDYYEFGDISKLPDPKRGLDISDDVTVSDQSLILISNELWIANKNDWTKLDNTNIPLYILGKNNLLMLDLEQYQKMVLIQGTRAYNYFAVGQKPKIIGSDLEYIIKAKGTIVKNNIEYTVLEFTDNVPPEGSSLYLEDNNNPNIIIWTDKESDHYNHKIPAKILPNTLFPKGPTYGAGTPVIYSDYLSEQLIENDIPTIYDIFNNQECNVKPYNRVKIYNSNTPYKDMADPKTIPQTFSYNLNVDDVSSIPQSAPLGIHGNLVAGYSYNLNNILYNQSRLSSNFQYIKEPTDNSQFYYSHLLNNIYNNGSDSYNIVELNSLGHTGLAYSGGTASGYVAVEGDYEFGYSYGFRNWDINIGNLSLEDIINRLKHLDSDKVLDEKTYKYEHLSIHQLQNIYSGLSDDPIECYDASVHPDLNTDAGKSKCAKTYAHQALSAKYTEKNNLLNTLDKIGIKYTSDYTIIYNPIISGTIPHITLSKSSVGNLNNPGGDGIMPIIINENIDNNRYWINIDPEQKCKTSRDASIKILAKAKYVCWPSTSLAAGDLGIIPTLDRDAQNVCPSETNSLTGNSFEFDSSGRVFTYTFNQQHIDSKKAEYKNKYGIEPSQWQLIEFPGRASADGGGNVTRSFFIRPNRNSQDIFVEVTETYWVPNEEYHKTYFGNPAEDKFELAYYEYSGKVKDIIPSNIIDDTNIVCRSKVIPRKLKRLDPFYKRYKFDFNGNYIEALPSQGPGGPFSNVLEIWDCYNKDTLLQHPIPDYFKIQNEMIYRAYFGSKDNIEYTTQYEDSKDPFEWIPYEYDHFHNSE